MLPPVFLTISAIRCDSTTPFLRLVVYLWIRKLNETQNSPSGVPVPLPLLDGKNSSAIPESWFVAGLTKDVFGSGCTVH